MRPFQICPSNLPTNLRHVPVLDFRDAIPPGAMCEKIRTNSRDEPLFVSPFGQSLTSGAPEPIRNLAMLHIWLSGEGDVAPGSGWTRRERWREFVALDGVPHDINGNSAEDDDLFAEALRYLQAPYHISAGVSSDGEPFVTLSHTANLYTHHGNRANRHAIGIGFAWGRDLPCDRRACGRHIVDHKGKDLVTPVFDVQAALARRDAVEAALWAAQRFYGTETLVTHAQSSRGRVPRQDGSGGDPGIHVMRAAGRAAQLHGFKFDPDTTWGTGRALPQSWRDAFVAGRADI